MPRTSQISLDATTEIAFATFCCAIPYSTLMTLLGRDIGGASFDIVIKICRKLEMDPLELTRGKDQK